MIPRHGNNSHVWLTLPSKFPGNCEIPLSLRLLHGAKTNTPYAQSNVYVQKY